MKNINWVRANKQKSETDRMGEKLSKKVSEKDGWMVVAVPNLWGE